jgi:colicin import membrane protein
MTQSSSVMFSLQELARMEEDRVRSAAEAEALENEARERARHEAEASARAEERERERAEAEARREIERRAREEAARIEAIHRAAVEAARVEAEIKASADERERARLYELETERARAAGRTTSRGSVMAGILGAVLAAGVAGALHFGIAAPRAQATLRVVTDQLASRDVAIAELRTRADAADGQVQALQASLATAQGANAKLQSDLDDLRRNPPRRPPGPAIHPGPGPGVRNDPRLDGLTTCSPGSKDPLCVH